MELPLSCDGPTAMPDPSGADLRAVERAAVALRRGGIALMTGADGDDAATIRENLPTTQKNISYD